MTAYDELGICAPRCPHCGWQAINRPDDTVGRAAAQADVVAHKAECPTTPCPAGCEGERGYRCPTCGVYRPLEVRSA